MTSLGKAIEERVHLVMSVSCIDDFRHQLKARGRIKKKVARMVSMLIWLCMFKHFIVKKHAYQHIPYKGDNLLLVCQ